MNTFQERLLKYLHIKEDEFPLYIKESSYEDIESPDNFINIDKCATRILKAIENNEKVMIYGDYDCDGISATSILVKMFQYLNKKVGYYIPSRYIDGYGININRSRQIVDKGYDLVITVDNGVSAIEAINYLIENKVDVILTDHHEIINELPKVDIIIHPDLKKAHMNLRQCGAYIAFMISCKVLNRIDDYLLSLAALATVSDMMPIKDANRALLKLALKVINNHPEYPFNLLRDDDNLIDEQTLGFVICPKINAFGRIKEDLSVNDMVRFLVSTDKKEINNIAREINLINHQRKDLLSQAQNNIDINKYQSEKVIIYRNDEISEGVIGLVAAKIVNQYHKPAFVFTKTKEGTIKGSARSLKGLDLSMTLKELSNYLLVYGGHEEAAGLSLNEEQYLMFEKALLNYASDKEIVDKVEDYLSIEYTDFTFENYTFIKSLSPYGIEFKEPRLGYKLSSEHIYKIGSDKQHIRGRINDFASFIGFNLAKDLEDDQQYIALGTMSKDDFKKGKNISFKIEKLLCE